MANEPEQKNCDLPFGSVIVGEGVWIITYGKATKLASDMGRLRDHIALIIHEELGDNPTSDDDIRAADRIVALLSSEHREGEK